MGNYSGVYSEWLFIHCLIPDQILIWKRWLFRKGESQGSGEKPLGTSPGTNNKYNPYDVVNRRESSARHW